MSNLVKLVGITLFGSAALAFAAAELRERPDVMKSAAQTAVSQQKKPNAQSVASQTVTGAGGNSATLYADPRGHFFADIQVRGVPLKVLVDTGASVVAMSHEDAAKLGIRPGASDRKAQFNTANGVVAATLVRLPEVSLQSITVYDVEAAIMPQGAMKGTLLGMSFMKKLSSYEARGVSMVMRK